ncbi:TPA: hypothetical protein ACJ29H_004395 [Salmonella enterica subsp. enterica serovar Wandsworth]
MHLLTFQSSKGLEFSFVVVINASFVHQGIAGDVLPGKQHKSPSGTFCRDGPESSLE